MRSSILVASLVAVLLVAPVAAQAAPVDPDETLDKVEDEADRVDEGDPDLPEDPTDLDETQDWIAETWQSLDWERCYLMSKDRGPVDGDRVARKVHQSCEAARTIFDVPDTVWGGPTDVPISGATSAQLAEFADDVADLDGNSATPSHGVAGSARVAGAEPVVPSDSATSPAVHWAVAVAVLLVPALLVLYRRLTRDELLDNEIRRTVYEAVRDEPGRTAAEIAEDEGVNYNTAQYHLARLEEFDEVVGRRDGHRTRYFVNHGRHGRLEKQVLATAADDTRRSILLELTRDAPLRSGTLADRAGVAPSTASHHLSRLAEEGLVERERDENEVYYFLRDRVASVVGRVVAS